MKELQDLRNEVLHLRNIGELTKQTESILLHKLNSIEEQLRIGGVVNTSSCGNCGSYDIDKEENFCNNCSEYLDY